MSAETTDRSTAAAAAAPPADGTFVLKSTGRTVRSLSGFCVNARSASFSVALYHVVD